jgi:hypothetical protein
MITIEECGLYIRNIKVRIESLKQYLNGGKPIIPEGAHKDEAILKAESRRFYEMYPSACGYKG